MRITVDDALDMAAIQDNFTDEDALRLTINAGADMLILPVNIPALDENYAITDQAAYNFGENAE